MKKMNIIKLAVIVLPIVLVLIAFMTIQKPKYIYPVRENVNPTENAVSWDLWCWYEYPNGKVSKKFLGSFTVYGTSTVGERVETSLCGAK